MLAGGTRAVGSRREGVAALEGGLVALQVSVIGSGAEAEPRAEEIGRLLAERGCVVVTGGRGEVMAAASRGAKSAGGATIAILPGECSRARLPC